jgi:hypothetical protein
MPVSPVDDEEPYARGMGDGWAFIVGGWQSTPKGQLLPQNGSQEYNAKVWLITNQLLYLLSYASHDQTEACCSGPVLKGCDCR